MSHWWLGMRHSENTDTGGQSSEISEFYKSPASTSELAVEQLAGRSRTVSENTKENMMIQVSWAAQEGFATLELKHLSHPPKPTSHKQGTESLCWGLSLGTWTTWASVPCGVPNMMLTVHERWIWCCWVMTMAKGDPPRLTSSSACDSDTSVLRKIRSTTMPRSRTFRPTDSA